MKAISDFIKKNIGLLFYFVVMFCVGMLDNHKSYKSHMLFYVIVLLWTLVIFFLKTVMKDNWIKIGIISIVFLVSFIMIMIGSRHYFKTYKLFGNVVPDKTTTLLQRALDVDDTGVQNSTFNIYYFRDKTVVCKDKETSGLFYDNVASKYYSESYYNYDIVIEDEFDSERMISNTVGISTKYMDNYGNVYVVDDGLLSSNRIMCCQLEDGLLFCSDVLYFQGEERGTEGVVSSNVSAVNQLASYTPNLGGFSYTMIVQFLSVTFFLIIGLIVSIALWNKLGGWLVGMISIPIGVIIWALFGTIMVAIRIPYNLVSQGIVLTVVLSFLIYKKREVFFSFNYRALFYPLFVIIGALLYFSVTCHTTTSYDSIKKLQFAFMLAIDNKPYTLFTNIAIFGLIEPFVHSLGFMLGGDYIYTIYPMFYILSLGIIIGSLYRVCENNNINIVLITKNKFIVLACVFAMGILITNCDFRYAKYYVMSHIMVSVFVLLLILFLYYYKREGLEYYECGIYLMTSAIIITRTEGILYILFFITMIGGYLYDSSYIRCGITTCLICGIWTIMQLLLYNGNDGEGFFFSPQKAIILTAGITVTVVFLLLRQKKIMYFLNKLNYAIIYLIGLLVVICVVSRMVGEMGAVNFSVYIGHLSSFIEDAANLGYLWSFVFFSVPFLLSLQRKSADLSVGIILGYLGLVFLIFLFRKELPIREGFGDSGRRVLVHIMPVTIFIILANMIEALSYLNKKERGKENA